jgi:hypothetical protein
MQGTKRGGGGYEGTPKVKNDLKPPLVSCMRILLSTKTLLTMGS